MEVGKKRKTVTKKAQKKQKTVSTSQSVTNTPPSEVEATNSRLWPGEFVALRLVKYKEEEPQIAKIQSVLETGVVIQWWTGLYHDVWTEWKVRSKVVTETVPKTAIIKSGIELSRSNRLSKELTKELKSLYHDVEYI